MKIMNFSATMVLGLSVATVAATSGRGRRATSQSCATVLDAEVCTWLVTERGEPVAMGATVPMSLVEAVPGDAEMVWPPQELGSVPMPEDARRLLGIDHLGINWEAHGHPPATFLTQHFDFHFYSIAQRVVRGIDCADDSKPSRLPAGYTLPDIDVPGMGILTGLCVPNMGMHAMLKEETTETEPFEASMMLGYYRGDPVFFEPMVSRDLLRQRRDFVLPMPRVEDLPEGVRYPTAFKAEYDADAEGYRLTFSDFEAGSTSREARPGPTVR